MTPKLLAMVAVAAWVAALAAVAIVVVRSRQGSRLHAEHGLLLGSLACFAAAPTVALIGEALAGSPSWFGVGLHLGFGVLLLAAAARARYGRRNPDAAAARMTYPEKSAILELAALCLVYVPYFAGTWNATLEEAVPAFIGAVVLLVILMIVGHTALALFHFPMDELHEAPDERARAVDLKSMRNAYFALGAGIWAFPVMTLLALPTVMIINAWLAVLVASELVYYGSRVAYYRLGTA